MLVQISATTPPALSLLDLLLKGGVVIIPILVLLGLSIFFFIERLLYIGITSRMKKDTVTGYMDMLQQGELLAAQEKASKAKTALERILYYGIAAIGNELSDIERNMESASGIEISRMEKRIGYLGIIAGVAPMLGFIGTISGIIRIFYDISLSDNISIGIIAGGLYEKMVSSGMGLITGVLAYVFYHILNMRIDSFTLRLQEKLLQFMTALQRKS